MGALGFQEFFYYPCMIAGVYLFLYIISHWIIPEFVDAYYQWAIGTFQYEDASDSDFQGKERY